MAEGGVVPPRRVGEYLLERRLGSGGMGVVYLARSTAGRTVALKVVRPEYAGDEGFRARFRREVAVARQVSGAFTAAVVDADTEGDPPWLATLHVPGGSLADRVQHSGPLPGTQTARLAAQLAEALRDIHRQGIVHRDLKPGNVLLAQDGVRVIDFGISRALADSRRLTEHGTILGSPPFMAPEQLTARHTVSEPADIFALGTVVAYAATGHSPFAPRGTVEDPLAIAYRVVHEEPDLHDIPPALHTLISSCLAKQPHRRPGVETVLRLAGAALARLPGDSAGPGSAAALPFSSPAAGETAAGEDDGDGDGDDADDRTAGGARPEAVTPPSGLAELPPGPGGAGDPPRRRRRWPLVSAAAVTVAAVATAGVWAVWGASGAAEDGDGNGAGPAATETSATSSPAAAFGPWERDLLELGVRDITENPRCRPLGEDGDRLLCYSGFAATVALDASDGSELWRHNPPRSAFTLPRVLITPDAVFSPSPAGLVALDPDDGSELWEIDVPALGQSMARTDSSLVVQNGDSALRFHALDSPERLGGFQVPGRYFTQLMAHGSRVLAESRVAGGDFPGSGPDLTLLDAAGRPLWPEPLRLPPEAQDLRMIGMDGEAAYFDEFDADGLPVSRGVWRLGLTDRSWHRTELPEGSEPRSALGENGVVYATDGAGRLTAVDAAGDGGVLWTAETGAAGPSSEPALAGGSIWFSGSDGRLHRVDASDGTPLWSGEPHEGTPGPGSDAFPPAPVVLGDRVYVITTGNTLYATRPG
ncbi:protein kinase domain-containing protein [Streptomyces aidingensis]|uniref:Serine/threonine protein kinase n=1 Tax=Streptomyces aidingensis TaxID=910347 RepID=A0A1I1TG95_9ACTN|nr:serine/threonine-protein kinase [Streptomyces aidingensis]SFD55413.1 Serine/threonine protein kinase [Streptomyces aidingensis]